MDKKYHVIGYLLTSVFTGIALTFGFANWLAGEGGDVMTQFWNYLPVGLVLGLVLGFFIYCYAKHETGL